MKPWDLGSANASAAWTFSYTTMYVYKIIDVPQTRVCVTVQVG